MQWEMAFAATYFGKAMVAVAEVERVPSITCDTNTGVTSKGNK